MGKDVIIALDFDSKEKTLAFLDRFTGEKPFVKIGMELFYAEGPSIVREIKARGHKIFLDLKLHDIPNTVKKAMAVLSSLDVDMVNLHAAGTRAMMSAALEGLTRADGTRPLLIAVTQLTSTSQQSMEEEIGIHAPLENVSSTTPKMQDSPGSTAWSAPRSKPAASMKHARRNLSPSPPASALPTQRQTTRCASPRPQRRARSARTTLSSAAPSRRRRIPSQPIAAASASSWAKQCAAILSSLI